jgi:hypothetical protein
MSKPVHDPISRPRNLPVFDAQNLPEFVLTCLPKATIVPSARANPSNLAARAFREVLFRTE